MEKNEWSKRGPDGRGEKPAHNIVVTDYWGGVSDPTNQTEGDTKLLIGRHNFWKEVALQNPLPVEAPHKGIQGWKGAAIRGGEQAHKVTFSTEGNAKTQSSTPKGWKR